MSSRKRQPDAFIMRSGSKNPLVSVVIPCWNAEDVVGDAIESALAQTYPHVEVIVVDDGSTDASLDVIRSFGGRVRWETGPNRGANAARNRGIELAKGELVQFLDADDLLDPSKIACQVEVTRSNSAAIVTCDHWEIDDRKNTLRKIAFDEVPDPCFSWILSHERLGISAPLHRKEHLAAVGVFDQVLPCSQEYDLHLRLAMTGLRLLHLHEALWTVRLRPGSISSNTMKVVRQHPRIFQRALAEGISCLDQDNLAALRRALGEACVRDARHALRHREYALAREMRSLAVRLDPGGRGRGFYRYNRLLHCVARTFGVTTAECLVKRSRGKSYDVVQASLH